MSKEPSTKRVTALRPPVQPDRRPLNGTFQEQCQDRSQRRTAGLC